MIKKFFTWGYFKFVFWPEYEKQVRDGMLELEIEFVPDMDSIESKHATKH